MSTSNAPLIPAIGLWPIYLELSAATTYIVFRRFAEKLFDQRSSWSDSQYGGLALTGKAADLKSAGRKALGVRIPRPPVIYPWIICGEFETQTIEKIVSSPVDLLRSIVIAGEIAAISSLYISRDCFVALLLAMTAKCVIISGTGH